MREGPKISLPEGVTPSDAEMLRQSHLSHWRNAMLESNKEQHKAGITNFDVNDLGEFEPHGPDDIPNFFGITEGKK